IGIAGPIFGFVIAVPVTIIGVVLTKLIGQPFEPEDGDVIIYGFPIVYRGIENMLAIFVGTGTYAVHPTAFAGWVGFLTTALNLLPIGQLDGGHIAKTIFGPKSKAISLLTIAFVLFFSWSIGDYSYLFFIVLVMFLGLDHPPPLNDITQLEMGRKLLAVGAAIMLIVCYVPAPFKTVSIEHIPAVDADFHNSVQGNVLAGLNISFDVDIKNTGNRDDVIVVDVFSIPKGWVSEMRIDAAIEHTSSNPLPQDAFSPNFTKNSREFTFMVSRGGVFNNTDPLNDPNIGYYPGSNNGSSDNSSGSTAGNGSGVPFSSYFARLPLKKESTVKGRIFFTPPQNASISAFHYIYVKVSSASDKEIYKTTMLNITVGYVEVNMISGILPVYPGSNQNITLKIDNLLFDRALDVEVEAILVPQNSSTFPQPYSLSWTKQEINLPPRLAQYLTIQLSTATTLNHFSNYSIGIEAYGVNLSQNNGNRSFLGRWNYTIPASVQDVLNGSVDKPYIFCASNSTDSQMLNFSLSISNPGPAYFWGNLTVELSSVSFSNGLPFSINWSADSQYILLHPRANTTIAVSILLPASVPSSVYDALFMFYPEGVSTPALTVESRIIVLQK
ncbi:MAG: site-2 protease family protein, partial [Thermoplasmata archaeon]